MKTALWTKNYSLLISATVLGSIGGIAGNFALSFLVFDETQSTLAAALILAIQIVPAFVLPLAAAPWMDRLPRKPFLVAGDAINGVLYALAGLYLMLRSFSYVGYLCFSLLLTGIETFDSLAYNSIYPMLIPKGAESRGYTVSSMLYPVLQVIMMPLAAVLLERIGVAWILIIQGALSVMAALTESRIDICETNRMQGEKFSLRMWKNDIKEAGNYLKNERGIRSIFSYMAVTNGVSCGYSPLLVAFFRVTPGFTSAMYAMFSVAEFAGRSLGGLLHYNIKIPPKKRFPFAFMVYMVYEIMDMCLLWLAYPLMLLNRGICGFLGINSAALRQSAVQQYIPDAMRARLNAYQNMLVQGCAAVLTLAVGALGEVMDYRMCVTACGGLSMAACFATIWRNRVNVRNVYETQNAPE